MRGAAKLRLSVWLGCAIAVSPSQIFAETPLCPDGPCFVDAEGKLADPQRAYQRVVARQRPRYLVAALELSAMIVGGAIYYGIDPKREVADWDLPSIKQRLSVDALRFDNNSFDINWLGHPFNGVWYHIYSRANGLSLPESIGFGFATSLAWEYAFEFNERASVNDLIATTGGGIAIGEFFHWMGRYFTSAPKNKKLAARWTFGIWQHAHGDDDNRGAPLDELGFSSDIWHRFDLGAGVATGPAMSESVNHLSVRAEFAALPGYLRPGHFSASFARGNITDLMLDLHIGDGGLGIDLEANTTILGYHWQAMDRSGGEAVTAGINIASRYRRQSTNSWVDRIGALHLPGPRLTGHFRRNSWHLEISAGAHADFASLDAAAYPAWQAANPNVSGKAILARNRYYFGWGASGSARAMLTTPFARLGGEVLAGRYRSQQGLDRSQEDVDYDVPVRDRVTDAKAWLDIKPLGGRLTLRALVEQHDRDNRVDSTFRVDKRLRRYSLQVGAVF